MATFRIVCTEQEPVYQPHSHAHIVRVGTGDSSGWSQKWTKDQVVQAIRSRRHNFYTYGTTSGQTAWVQAVRCSSCSGWIIKSAPDAVRDNNLDNLPACAR